MEDKNRKHTWETIQAELADNTGLAIAILKNAGLKASSISNNNSICEQLTASKELRGSCEKFCGSVYDRVQKEKRALKYKCHAGLECVAVPLKRKGDQIPVAITGRVFSKANDYRAATERAVSGEWKNLPPTRFFENVLLTSASENVERLAKRLTKLSDSEREALEGFLSGGAVAEQTAETTPVEEKSAPVEKQTVSEEKKTPQTDPGLEAKKDAEEFAAWRTLFSSLHTLQYGEACLSILKFIGARYEINSLAWLENVDNKLSKKLAIGSLQQQKFEVSLRPKDERLREVFRKRGSIELKNRVGANKEGGVRLFPIAVGGVVRSALVTGERTDDTRTNTLIARFCQLVSSELEILRLRQQLNRKTSLDSAFSAINKSIARIDSNSFWLNIMQTAADLVGAGRGSLLVYDEKGENLVVRAAIGKKADFVGSSASNIGERIAKNVWKTGKPLMVRDINAIGLPPAPADREYSSGSFISFPLSIAGRRVGVLNVTDKKNGGVFERKDLDYLRSIAPQLAVAIDRASLKNKAGEFEQLSVTDPLTGLLNRRYLEERLTEEIKRSDRHGYPMSFLMIDVDNFKSYNDTFTHPEGDKALQLVGKCIRDSLRDADVAARYGGEEFSILLPQTNLEEARIIGERIRNKIATTKFPNRQVTVSVGITGASSSRDTAEAIISAADKALFEAKRRGRNNVQTYEYVRKDLKV